MLTLQRQEMILKLLKEKGSVTTLEISEKLGISESTARRDISYLDKEGRLSKVFGGAALKEQQVTAYEYTFEQKNDFNIDEKKKIARYAASLIEKNDFVYLDAGTTTAYMIDYIEGQDVTFVTNGITHARQLAARGFKVYLVGGELKASTEAIIGSYAMETLKSYHFTKGFFGTNRVTRDNGCTTPDANEALIKKMAMSHYKKSYVLSDYSKFNEISSVTFAPFEGTDFICDRTVPGYEKCNNITVIK